MLQQENSSLRSDGTRGDPCPAPSSAAFGKLPVDFSHALLHAGTLFHVRWSLDLGSSSSISLRCQRPQSGCHRLSFEARSGRIFKSSFRSSFGSHGRRSSGLASTVFLGPSPPRLSCFVTL